MDVFTAGQSVVRILPFKGEQGVVTPTALSYRILDEVGEEVTPPTPITDFDANAGEYRLTVTAEENTLESGAISGVRKIELTLTSAIGTFRVVDSYIIEASEKLIFGRNSLMTYEQAMLLARQMGQLKGWERADESRRVSALMRAYDNLAGIAFHWEFTDGTYWDGGLREFEDEDFRTLDPDQLEDFRKAQLVQADYHLGGNPIEKNIADGLQSSTVGEVSQFYRPRPNLSLMLCRAALQYVGRYINWSMRLTRT